jgi:nucleoside-diphosphate-sugar epimerase
MKLLVTGATSNVGADLSVTLAARGHQVRALALPGHPQDHLDSAKIPITYADVTDEEAVLRAAGGAEAVIHCAAHISFYARDRDRSFAVNVGGARACVRAARRAGARRFVHVSSCGVYGILRGRERVDEASPTPVTGLAYNDSKREAEAAVAAEAGDLTVTVLRLAGCYGRFDRINIPPTAAALRRGIYVYFGDPEKPHNLLGTHFLAEAVARLLDEPTAPRVETFIACEGEPPTYRSFVEAVADELGLGHPRGSLSATVARGLGTLFDLADRARLPRPTLLSLPRALAENSIVDAIYDGSALRRRLSLPTPDTLAEVRRATAALRASGRITL